MKVVRQELRSIGETPRSRRQRRSTAVREYACRIVERQIEVNDAIRAHSGAWGLINSNPRIADHSAVVQKTVARSAAKRPRHAVRDDPTIIQRALIGGP